MIIEEKVSLEDKLKQWKKGYSFEDLKSIVNQIEDPIIKLIARKILIEKNNKIDDK